MRTLSSIRLDSNLDLAPLKKLVRSEMIPFENSSRDDQSFSPEIAKRLHALGYLQAVTPKEFGGQGADVVDLIWIVREISYGSASTGAMYIGNLLGYSAPLLYGQPKLRAEIASQYAREFSLFSFAMTEGGAGSDLQNIATTARRTKGGFILNGEKNYITNANFSKRISVFARLIDESGKEEGISCFLVQAGDQGLVRGEALNKIGLKRANTGSLKFENVFVSEDHLLGKPGQGLQILTHCLNRSKTLLAAMGVGISLRACDLSIERLSETNRFGKTLLEQSAIRHQLARMITKVEAAWLMVNRAASTWDAELSAVKEASMAKLVAGATAVDVCNQAMELFGARGFLMDYEVSRLVSDAKSVEIVEGPTLVQELLIAKEVLPRVARAEAKRDLFKLTDSDAKKRAA